MVAVDGGQSAIVFGCCDDPTPVMKLFCDNNDPGQCKWKPLEFSLPFEADWPVSILIPNEIVPDCK